jgi:4-aminobutyrate aminotransferase
MIERDSSILSPSYSREYALVVDKAQGSEIWDLDGKRYIDFMAGVAVLNVGHRHPYVVEKVQEQLDKFWHICLADFYYPQAIALAEKIQAIAPMEDTMVYFGNSGTEAVEAALKLAMFHTGRSKFLGFLGSFHGRTQEGIKVHHVPFPDPYRPLLYTSDGQGAGDAVINYIEQELFRTIVSPDDIAGVLVEPIQGEGGYIIPEASFFPRLGEMCDRYGILLITDEIQSGAGRTGKWWATEHEGIKPDIMCFAKGIGSGMPIGGIAARRELMSWGPGSHGSTYGGNPIAAVSALATIEVIEQEGILEQATETGTYILDALAEIQARHHTIGDVRGRGLMIGIEFVEDASSKERNPEIRERIIQDAFESGLLLIPCGPNSIRMTPALNISRDLVDEGLMIFESALTRAEKTAQCSVTNALYI